MDRGDPQIAESQPRLPASMVHGSLWDDDKDMILGQVADDRTKKGMVKMSAVVDSGAEANALAENMKQCSLKVRKDLPRRRGGSHPCAR